MPFVIRIDGDPVLSPATQKSVMPFNNVRTIQDVLNGIPYNELHGGGNWSSGEDIEKSYKDKGSDYKSRAQFLEREKRDKEIAEKLLDLRNTKLEKWRVKVPGGSKYFMSLEMAQKYIRDNNLPYSYLTKMAQNASKNEASVDRIDVITNSIGKCYMVESIDPVSGLKETGSAFCVKLNYFITCAHVIKNYNKTEDLNELGFGSDVYINMVQNGNRFNAELISFDLAMDIALLRCEVDSESFKLDTKPVVGEDIIAIGSPHGYENNVSIGTVGSLGRKPFNYEGAPDYMFVDLSVFPGSSGAPLIKESDGRVVGMVTLIVSSGSEYGLNAALPSSYIEGFCRSNIEGF